MRAVNMNRHPYRLFKDKCQSLTRLIVTAADDSSKLLLTCTLGEEPYRQLSFNLINLVLVSFLRIGYIFTIKITHEISLSLIIIKTSFTITGMYSNAGLFSCRRMLQ